MVFSKHKAIHFKRKAGQMGYQIVSGFLDMLAYYLNIPVTELSPAFQVKNSIIYVCDNNWPRVARMAKWLKRYEEVNVLHLCSTLYFNKNFDTDMYDGIALYRNGWHLRRIIRAIKNPQLIQGFAPSSYNPSRALKQTKGVYVHDMQDVLVSYNGLESEDRGIRQDMPSEKYCLENSTGIIGECLEVQEAFRTYSINKKPVNIFFPLYCDDDYFSLHKKEFRSDDIHLVYAGQIHGSWRPDKPYGTTKFFKLIEELSKQNIHLHIYPNPGITKSDSNEYEQLARIKPYFHFHDTVSQKKLPEELSQYDFGILPFFKTMGGSSDTKFKYATTMKLFNYWEGALPIIVSADLFYQSWLVQRYNAGIVLTSVEQLSYLKSLIVNYDQSALIANVYKAREKMSLSRNIGRLSDFYRDLGRGQKDIQ